MDRQTVRSETEDPAEERRRAYEREFWSTFGEQGICAFWGVGVDELRGLDGTTRGTLVGYTNEVGRRPEAECETLLAEVTGLPADARVARLCELAAVARPDP